MAVLLKSFASKAKLNCDRACDLDTLRIDPTILSREK
jgi:hypothetical protein